MRKLIGTIAIAAVGTALVAQAGSGGALGAFGKALNEAQALRVSYNLVPIGGAPKAVTVDLSKPNRARLETPTQLIVLDGKEIVTFNKRENKFARAPQTEAELAKLMARDEFSMWAGFFNADAMKGVRGTRDLGVRNRRGMQLQAIEVNLDPQGRRKNTLYIDRSDNLVRQAEMVTSGGGGTDTTVLEVRELAVNGTAPADLFAFKAPANAQQVSLEELQGGKWYTNLQEAMKVAQASGKRIFVDFMATWCGPCKELDREVLQTPEWKAYSKHFVMVKIDVDAQPSVASAYNVTAMPTQMVLDAQGNIIGQTVGYGGPAAFYEFVNRYRG